MKLFGMTGGLFIFLTMGCAHSTLVQTNQEPPRKIAAEERASDFGKDRGGFGANSADAGTQALSDDQLLGRLDLTSQQATGFRKMGPDLADNSAKRAALDIVLQTEEGPLAVRDIVKSLINVQQAIKASVERNRNSPLSEEYYSEMEGATAVFSYGVCLVASKIVNSSKSGGRSAANLLLSGKEIAEGKMSQNDTRVYFVFMNKLILMLKQNPNISADVADKAVSRSMGIVVN